MGKIIINTLALILGCSIIFYACLGNDNDDNWSNFNNIPVTVINDPYLGCKLITDFDAVLVPSDESISSNEWIKDVRRAIVSFSLNGNNCTQLETGSSYNVTLNSKKGVCRQIPDYSMCVDTLKDDYQTSGKDSIAFKNKIIRKFENTNQFYIKNGFMNLVASFDYHPTKFVYFGSYYNGLTDINTAKRELMLNLYFNNNAVNPYGTTSSILSLKLSDGIYEKFMEAGLDLSDSIAVILKANTANGTEEMKCKMALEDILLPGSFN